MSSEAQIHSWSGSYYVDADKRWEKGRLSLNRTSVQFVSSQSPEALVSFRLASIVEMKMEASSFIFSTLTVLLEGNLKHWFGSLKPNRLVVFNVLEHFWREKLLATGPGSPAGPTGRGRDLVSLVAGAQRRLEDTGRVLSHQGEQFDHMVQGLEKMDSDLSTADKLLSELESPSWWLFSRLPWKVQQEPRAEDASRAAAAAVGRGSGQTRVLSSVPAVVWRGLDCDSRPGVLLVLVSALELRQPDGRLLHRFQRGEVDELLVQTPYQVTLRQRFIGRPDVCFTLLSVKMPEALLVLEMQYKKKIHFSPEHAAFRAATSDSPGAADSDVSLDLVAADVSQLQVRVQTPAVSRAEAQELKQMLTQLKTLAVEAETELERQDEVLDVLASSTDRTTMTIEKHTGRMRRLL